MTSMIPGVSCVIWLARIPYDLCHVLGIMQVDGGFGDLAICYGRRLPVILPKDGWLFSPPSENEHHKEAVVMHDFYCFSAGYTQPRKRTA